VLLLRGQGPPTKYASPYQRGLGVFDSKHEDDPVVANKVWRVASSIDIDRLNNPLVTTYNGWWMVSTVLSSSTNNGTAWGSDTIINQAVSRRDGYLKNHEVPCLVYDAGDADANRRWKCIWMVFYMNKALGPTDYRDLSLAWFAMKTAPDPTGPWSAEIKLMAGTAYSSSNAIDGGACLFTEAGGTIVSEPGVCAHPTSGFYLVYTVAAGVGPANDLVKLCRIHHNGTAWTKTDLGQPVTMAVDALRFRTIGAAFPATFPDWTATAGITACDIAKVGATYHLIMTPQTATYAYRGFMTVAFTNIDTATLSRSGGDMVTGVALDVHAGGPYHHGAATYSSKSTGSGIVYSFLNPLTPPTVFTLQATGVPIP
jgi:hypothetical protein